jgi:hypothetical protein
MSSVFRRPPRRPGDRSGQDGTLSATSVQVVWFEE